MIFDEDTIKQNGKWVNKGKEGTHGTFRTKKAADAQRKAMYANGFSEDLNEELYAWEYEDRRNELIRAARTQVILQPNGMFNIYNVKESDVDMLIRRLEELDYVEYVHKTAGRYDFNTMVMPGQLPKRYFTVSGKVNTD